MAAISEIECNPEKTFELDPYLREVQGQIWDRVNGYKKWMRHIESEGGLAKFAEGYNQFGFHPIPGGQRFTEWLPGAKRVFLTGEYIFYFITSRMVSIVLHWLNFIILL